MCLHVQLSVLQAGALGVNSCNVDGFTPLHVAALHGHSALAALLIRHGANVNARTNQSATPLHLATQNSHVQVGGEQFQSIVSSSFTDFTSGRAQLPSFISLNCKKSKLR